MCADVQPEFRLVVKRYGEVQSQGTAWFVTRSKVITAWHVIEDMDGLPDVQFVLELEGEPIELDFVPGSEDRAADVAVLRVREADRVRIQASMVLALADRMPSCGDKWRATGFPSLGEGKDRTVDGEVTNPSTGNGRVELFLRQGTNETWKGLSGAALIIENRVAGVITGESGHRDSTGFARPYSAVEKIVPELKGRANRFNYRDWFRDEFRPPDWCQAYTPRVAVEGPTPQPVDELGGLLAKRSARRVWLVVGDETEGRDALLRRIADAFVQSGSRENEDCFDLPVWCDRPPHTGEPVDLLCLTRDRIKNNARNIPASTVATVLDELGKAKQQGRALFIVDGADVGEIDGLRQSIGDCPLLAGVSESVAAGVQDAQTYRIVALSDADRRGLARCWLTDEQTRRWVDSERDFLPLAWRPLDVSTWCRAGTIFERPMEAGREELEGKTAGRTRLLSELVDCLLNGQHFADHPWSRGVAESREARVVLARLAYASLIGGKEAIEPTWVVSTKGEAGLGSADEAAVRRLLDDISQRCGLLQKAQGETYRFAHAAVHEYLAGYAMFHRSIGLGLQKLATHAAQVQGDAQIAKWSRALALGLDAKSTDANKVVRTLLNYGLPEGGDKQLRSKAGPLDARVCQAILNTETLSGEQLRTGLGWLESPHDWTGYQPDEWRAIEERLRFLDGVACRVQDDECLARLFARILREAKILDVALVRYFLANLLKKRPSKQLVHLYERKRFFEVAGRSCRACDKVKPDLLPVREGWFLMGAPESEERSWPNEHPRHRVHLREFYMSRAEVTNAQYEIFDPTHADCRFAGDSPEQHGKITWDRHPVVRVSWYEAWCFAEWMGLRLPTEAQWEKAARGVSLEERPKEISQEPKPYWFSGELSDLKDVAWFSDNSGGCSAEVDKQQSDNANLGHEFGLGGLCGNVWEWCLDERGFEYTEDDREDPEAYESPADDIITNRVIRGGSWDSPAWNCRHAVRHYAFPTVRAPTIGFRLCANSLDQAAEYLFQGD